MHTSDSPDCPVVFESSIWELHGLKNGQFVLS